jgi:tellurite resistance protein TehA-like permease
MPHLNALGAIFFILNMVLFVFNITMISIRFYLYPSTFRASFLHPTESLFVPAAIISFGTILINITQYGIGRTGHWLESTMIVLFWIYCTLAILFSCGIYLLMYVLPPSLLIKTNTPQLEHANIHNSTHDSNLDFPSLPPPHHRSLRQ